jgi:LDH2 family malate/lactate/ureidoglycolate dehydrogenase
MNERTSASQNKIIGAHEDLARFIRDALVVKGARAEDAAIVADELVWANLRGVDGHGVSRLPFYLRMIERGEIDVTAKPLLMHDRTATFVLDGGRGVRPGGDDAGACACHRARRQVRRLLRPRARHHPYRRHRPLCAMDGGARPP